MTTAEGVEEIVARAARANGRCAIDTEFFWERTYAPQLCFVQVAVQGEVTLIDPLAGAPLDAIAALVADPDGRDPDARAGRRRARVRAPLRHAADAAARHAGGGRLRRADGVGQPRAAAERRPEGVARPPRVVLRLEAPAAVAVAARLRRRRRALAGGAVGRAARAARPRRPPRLGAGRGGAPLPRRRRPDARPARGLAQGAAARPPLATAAGRAARAGRLAGARGAAPRPAVLVGREGSDAGRDRARRPEHAPMRWPGSAAPRPG